MFNPLFSLIVLFKNHFSWYDKTATNAADRNADALDLITKFYAFVAESVSRVACSFTCKVAEHLYFNIINTFIWCNNYLFCYPMNASRVLFMSKFLVEHKSSEKF